jgi:hypothetical protein
MTWNYRVVAVPYEDEVEYGIYEVYYDKDGVPFARTEDAVPCVGEDLKECRDSFEKMRMAFDMPTLTDADFVWGDLSETEYLS